MTDYDKAMAIVREVADLPSYDYVEGYASVWNTCRMCRASCDPNVPFVHFDDCTYVAARQLLGMEVPK